ncbi:MAG TPA: cofactor-independent phosphoglycerate mutase [Candidatus Hydrogenedens sp.]|nr:cofactor-independent phosphoglycerate mutase [Candidatus Hydrogenedens sp.]HPP59196.1 cofactor-independent phosphoglycerate mutase [Candidatus Hydrogenedens sp.]
MKYLILVGDGMADYPLPELEGKTPLQVAETPAMDEVASRGMLGLFCPIPDGLPPGSDIGNLSLFGFDPRTCFTGRAPLEAARQGIRLNPTQVAFRCNIVSLQNGKMRDFTAGHIPTDKATILIKDIGEVIAKEFPVNFYPGVSYRHLAVIDTGEDFTVEDLEKTDCTPPHDITDQSWQDFLPKGPCGSLLQSIMTESQKLLPQHPISQERVQHGEPEPNSFWLWGQGRTPQIKTFKEMFNLHGVVISAVDLVKGIGICAGLESIDVPGATGWIDTNYKGKIETALDALARVDFAFVHIEAPDESAHQGDLNLKIKAIEDFDKNIVRPALEFVKHSPDEIRLFVAPDHITALSTRTHAPGPVPFAMCGPGIESYGMSEYHEFSAKGTGIIYTEAHELIKHFLLGSPFYIGKNITS